MTIYILTACDCEEYGCMGFVGAFSTAEKAHEHAKKRGWQNEYHGEDWCFKYDYYEVLECEIDKPEEWKINK